jgi:hypothetical protein
MASARGEAMARAQHNGEGGKTMAMRAGRWRPRRSASGAPIRTIAITFSSIYVVSDTDQDSRLSFGIFVEFISKTDDSIPFFFGHAAIRDQKANSVYSIFLAYHFGTFLKC